MLINIYRDEAEQHKVEITKCSSKETLIIYKHCELQTDGGSQKISSSKKN